MNRRETNRGERERRAAPRFAARLVARLRFVTPVSDLRGVDGPGLWPTLICETRDVSERGVALLVPALREGDENFFGVKGPVQVTLALPTGAVTASAAAVRYDPSGAGPGAFLVCVEITETEGPAAERWASHVRCCAPEGPS